MESTGHHAPFLVQNPPRCTQRLGEQYTRVDSGPGTVHNVPTTLYHVHTMPCRQVPALTKSSVTPTPLQRCSGPGPTQRMAYRPTWAGRGSVLLYTLSLNLSLSVRDCGCPYRSGCGGCMAHVVCCFFFSFIDTIDTESQLRAMQSHKQTLWLSGHNRTQQNTTEQKQACNRDA